VKRHKIGKALLDPTVCPNNFEDKDPTNDDELEELKRERVSARKERLLPCSDLQMEEL